MSILELFVGYIKTTSPLELTAVFTSLTYVILAARGSRLCWYFAFASSSIYMSLFFGVQLYLESILQLFYVVMAVYGFLSWNTSESSGKIKKWPVKYHLINAGLSLLATLLLGYLFSSLTDQSSPYIDAFTTTFSLAATFMVAQRVLENWIYWIIIDAVSTYLYFSKGLEISGMLMFVYTILAAFGLFRWYKQYQLQRV